MQMVSQDSAIRMLPSEPDHDQLSRSVTHSDFAKFDSPSDHAHIALRKKKILTVLKIYDLSNP